MLAHMCKKNDEKQSKNKIVIVVVAHICVCIYSHSTLFDLNRYTALTIQSSIVFEYALTHLKGC